MKRFAVNGILVRLNDEGREIFDSGYLYYLFEHLHNQGHFRNMASGTLKLQHLRASDVANIQFEGGIRLGDIAKVRIVKEEDLQDGDIILTQKGNEDALGKPRRARRKKKKKKTPPFITEELFSLRDHRIGDGREAVFQQEDLSQVGDYSSASSEIHPGMTEVPFQTSSGRTLYILFMQEAMKTSLFGVADQWFPGVEIMFYDKSQEGEALVELSKKGEAFEILRVALAHTQQYLQKNPSLPIVTFTAANEEESRVSLYRLMARKFSGHEPEVTQDAKVTRFTVKNPHYEETTRISRRERIARGIRAVRRELFTKEGLESADIPDVDYTQLSLDEESLQERVPFTTSSGREFTVLFRMGKRTEEHSLDEMPVVEVGLVDDEGKMEITGGGEAVQIIQKTLAIIDKYLQSNRDFPFVVFSSPEDERGRRRLYRKIAENFSPDGTFMEEQDGPYRTFVIRNPYAELDERGEPWGVGDE